MADKKTLEMLIKVITANAVRSVSELSGDIKEVSVAATKAAKDASDAFGTSMAGAVETAKRAVKGLAEVTAALKVDQAVASLAKSALSASTSFRAAKDDFGIMLGDMRAGAAFFEELQEFNFWTPFDIESTSQAAKVLMAAKVPLGEITDYLTRFGDIAQGDAQRFQSFINAFSKASAKGKADMEVLNVYIDQGVQILDALGKQLGVTSAEVTKMASKGEISFKTLDDALASMAAEGGQYYNTMATASQRLDSVYAGLEESTKSLAASFGDMLAPAISAVLSFLTDVVDAINSSPLLKGVLAAAITAVVTLLNVKMVSALVAVIAEIWPAFTAQMALNSAMGALNPAVLAATAAVTIAVGAYAAFAAEQQDAAKGADEAALALARQKDSVSNLTEEIKNMSREARNANIANLEAEKNALEVSKKTLEIRVAAAEKQMETAKKQMPANELEGLTWLSENQYDKIEAAQNADKLFQQASKNAEELGKELAEVTARYDSLTSQIEAYNAVTAEEDAAARENAFNDAVAETNKEIEHRNRLYSQTQEGQLAALEEELAFAKELLTKETLDADGRTTPYNKKKTLAIIADLEKRIEELKRKMKPDLSFTDEWTKKNLEGIEKIDVEEKESLNKLQEQALAALGEKYAESEEYEAQLLALQTYYANQRSEYQKRLDDEEQANREKAAKKLADEEKERLSLVEQWTEKNLTGVERIQNEWDKAQKDLADAFSSLGDGWQENDGYLKALAEMKTYYEGLLASENKRVDFTDEWTKKNLDGIAKIDAEEEESLARLQEQALAALGEKYAETEEYETQLFAMQTYYDSRRREYQDQAEAEAAAKREESARKLADAEKSRLSLIDKWTEKNLTGVERIQNEWSKAQQELADAFSSLGDGWQNDDGYLKTLVEMKTYYEGLIASENKRADFTDEWTRKNLNGLEKINAERAESEQKLKELALASLGEEYEQAEAYQKELAALTLYYNKKVMEEEATARADFVDEWTNKDLDGIARIKRERMEAYIELSNKAEEAFGEGWQNNEQYKAAQSAMMEHFNKELSEAYESAADLERRTIMDAHSQRMQNIKEEAEYRMELARAETERARETGSFGEAVSAYAGYAGAAAGSAMSGTQLGQALAGADPITMFIDALVEAVASIESVNKVLNFASTIVGSMMEVIEPMIDSIFRPLSDLLSDIGTTIGMVLAPMLNSLYAALSPVLAIVKLISGALQLFAKLFEWVNNKIIVPFGNAIIDGVNSVLRLLNKIPGVEIELLDNLQLVGEAAQELAAEAEKAAELTKKKYDRQRRAVEEQLDAQLDSIQAQYRLGLISREDYEAQAEQYQSAADEKLYDINVLMEEELARIEANTRAGLTQEQTEKAQEIASGRKTYADQLSDEWGENLGTFGEVAGSVVGTVADIGAGIVGAVVDVGKNIWDGIGGLFGWWDVGSTNIPHDQFGMVHQGEAVIPRTFAEGIRRGDMAVVGGKNGSGASSSSVYVTVNVGGSVLAENELVDTVYNGILRGIEHRKYAPLGA